MGVNTKFLFAFDRSLPSPYDTRKSKKVKISSTYGDGLEATLSCSFIKAIHAYLRCIDGSGQGALGELDGRSIAEYKSALTPGAYHLVVYDAASGNIMASVYDQDTDLMEVYELNGKGRDGSAINMALLPVLLKDEEFRDTLEEYREQFALGLPDIDEAARRMAILCDNAYRRIVDQTCPAHIKLNVDKAGNLTRVSRANIDAGRFVPKTVLAGEFIIFAKTGPAPTYAPPGVIDHKDFVGQHSLNSSRILTAREQMLIPQLPPWYIIPKEVVGICKHAVKTTSKALPMRNFLLRGPAGTGKTMGAQAIAAGLNLPYVKYTCSANTEVFDFIGQVFPDTAAASTGDPTLDQERETLSAMGGMTYANVAKLMKLPDLADMDYDPEGVYLALTGQQNPGVSAQDCMQIVLEQVAAKLRALCAVQAPEKSQSYTYIETDFIRALKYGWLVEVQEPTVIMQPGVLVGLNSLLEQAGAITLPTGEVITRHPDAVVVVTTNISYEGCRGLNQSVIDRMSLARDIELPAPDVMAQRAIAVTGYEDEVEVMKMVKVVCDMADFMRKNGIADGNCGMRSLIDWISSTEVTGDPYISALYTVVAKATADEEDRFALISSVLEPVYAPKGWESKKSA